MHINKHFEISHKGRDCFFGYYDRSMSSPDGKTHLFLSVENALPVDQREGACTASLCLASQRGEVVSAVLTTDAWSYQLGNLNTWLDNDHFVYHANSAGGVQSHLYSVSNAASRHLSDLACYTVQAESGLGVFFDIGRCGSIRPAYGLGGTQYGPFALKIIDIHTGGQTAELSEAMVTGLLPDKAGFFAYAEHALFFNDTPEILLLLRAVNQSSGERFERLAVWNFQTNCLNLVESITKATHFCVSNDDRIFAFGSASVLNKSNKLKGFIKKLPFANFIRKRSLVRASVLSEQYRLLNLKTNTTIKIPFFEDGHPSPFNGDIVFDTYDKDGLRTLYFFDLKLQTYTKLAEFESDLSTDRTPFRCDLHPRSAGDNIVAIDHIVSGQRQVSFFEISR